MNLFTKVGNFGENVFNGIGEEGSSYNTSKKNGKYRLKFDFHATCHGILGCHL